jgi:hypothetical protein
MDTPTKACVLLTGVVTSCIVIGLSSVGATSSNLSHSYKTTDTLTTGNIVSLNAKESNYVEPATVDNGSRILGIVVAKNDSLLAVDEKVSGGIQVATSGNAKALVSTVNGAIKVGDQVGVSPFSGVGMKASPGSRVIGLAQENFNDSSKGVSYQTVRNKSGKETRVAIGFENINIAVGVNTAGNAVQNLSALQKLGKSLTGHTVSNTRVVISSIVAFVALCSIITLIYASIYGGIISVGRNPLAKYAVYRTVTAVMAMVAITAAVAGAIIFLLLR